MSVFLKLDRGMEFLIGPVENITEVKVSEKLYFQPKKTLYRMSAEGSLCFKSKWKSG